MSNTPIEEATKCGKCHACLEGKSDPDGWPLSMGRMVLCVMCGNKRCPHATDCALACTDSNKPGQKGSVWENYRVPE